METILSSCTFNPQARCHRWPGSQIPTHSSQAYLLFIVKFMLFWASLLIFTNSFCRCWGRLTSIFSLVLCFNFKVYLAVLAAYSELSLLDGQLLLFLSDGPLLPNCCWITVWPSSYAGQKIPSHITAILVERAINVGKIHRSVGLARTFLRGVR